MNERTKIYTAGVCSGNQLKENKGGYGAVMFYNNFSNYNKKNLKDNILIRNSN